MFLVCSFEEKNYAYGAAKNRGEQGKHMVLAFKIFTWVAFCL